MCTNEDDEQVEQKDDKAALQALQATELQVLPDHI